MILHLESDDIDLFSQIIIKQPEDRHKHVLKTILENDVPLNELKEFVVLFHRFLRDGMWNGHAQFNQAKRLHKYLVSFIPNSIYCNTCLWYCISTEDSCIPCRCDGNINLQPL